MLAADEVAAAVLPFLTTGELCSTRTQESNTPSTIGRVSTGKGLVPFLSLRTSSPYAVWRIWRTILVKPKRQLARSKKEARLMQRLRTNRTKKLDETVETRTTTKRRRLLGQRPKKARTSPTQTTKKRFFLRNTHSNSDTTTTEKRFFLHLSRRPSTSRSARQKT
jgi:hypothetical protein